MVTTPIRVLFVCTHNAARSQMAEALLRSLGGERFAVQSAGTDPTRVHPLAVSVMAGIAIAISGARSRHVEDVLGQRFDDVMTVCERARETCPVFNDAPDRIAWSYPDPAAVDGSEAARPAAFERVRTDLLARLRTWLIIAERFHGVAP